MKDFHESTIDDMFIRVSKMHKDYSFHVYSDLGLFFGQAPILDLLCEQDGIIQAEIANKLNIKPSTATICLQRMEKNGLLERRSDKCDHRIVKVYMTDEGRALQSKIPEVRKLREEVSMKGFTQEEILNLRDYFERIFINLAEADKEYAK